MPASKVLGEEDRGFEVANEWLGNPPESRWHRCAWGRADRALSVAAGLGGLPGAVRPEDREVPGRLVQAGRHAHGRMVEAELMTYRAAWLMDQGAMSDGDAAMAKISSTEMLQFVSDEAIQILGGMGLMDELPLERIWRDARVDRIWDGTSEIQRHILSREMLRPLGA